MHQTIRSSLMGWHLHREAYAALVLQGGYEEAGDYGRLYVTAGDVVFHDLFSGHLNRFCSTGAVVFNLPLSAAWSFLAGHYQVADAEAVLRLARICRQDAVELLLETTSVKPSPAPDWPDLLAQAVINDPALRLSDWAEQNRLAPWHLSRGFMQVFGITPEAFRLRCRTRKAFHAIVHGDRPLSGIATECGFADQAHMTRSIRKLTGMRPRQWRSAANGFKTQALAAL